MQYSTVIRSIIVQPDASGAPAVVMVDGYTIALDFVGHIRSETIGQPKRGTVARRRAAVATAKREYATRLSELVGQEWLYGNVQMYSSTSVEREDEE